MTWWSWAYVFGETSTFLIRATDMFQIQISQNDWEVQLDPKEFKIQVSCGIGE